MLWSKTFTVGVGLGNTCRDFDNKVDCDFGNQTWEGSAVDCLLKPPKKTKWRKMKRVWVCTFSLLLQRSASVLQQRTGGFSGWERCFCFTDQWFLAGVQLDATAHCVARHRASVALHTSHKFHVDIDCFHCQWKYIYIFKQICQLCTVSCFFVFF